MAYTRGIRSTLGISFRAWRDAKANEKWMRAHGRGSEVRCYIFVRLAHSYSSDNGVYTIQANLWQGPIADSVNTQASSHIIWGCNGLANAH